MSATRPDGPAKALFELTRDRRQDKKSAAPQSPNRHAGIGGKDLLVERLHGDLAGEVLGDRQHAEINTHAIIKPDEINAGGAQLFGMLRVSCSTTRELHETQ
jgi:hypothetical protein